MPTLSSFLAAAWSLLSICNRKALELLIATFVLGKLFHPSHLRLPKTFCIYQLHYLTTKHTVLQSTQLLLQRTPWLLEFVFTGVMVTLLTSPLTTHSSCSSSSFISHHFASTCKEFWEKVGFGGDVLTVATPSTDSRRTHRIFLRVLCFYVSLLCLLETRR